MSLREILTRKRKMPKKLVQTVDHIMNVPYIYVCGPCFGLVLACMESAPMQTLRRTIRPDMENQDLGNFVERFKLGYNSVKDAFNYRPEGYYDK